jgi:DeoR/GlpR family transcriptional regulator of sugar metabolism
MLAAERRNEILDILQEDGRVVVSELSGRYEVSEETIRRDLDKLETDGFVIKSYGGAVLNEKRNIDMPFNIRKNRNVVAKQKIAELFVELINDGDSIMFDASSTSLYIVRALKEKKKNLTIITNSIEIIIELLDQSDWQVISTGGTAREGTFALVGPGTDRAIRSYHVDRAIISCKGLDIDAGITDSDELAAHNKITMLSTGKKRILAIDHTKFEQIAFTQIGGLDEISTVVTDKKPDKKWLRILEDKDIKCVYSE